MDLLLLGPTFENRGVVYEANDPPGGDVVARIEAALSLPFNITALTTVDCPASVGYADTRTAGVDPVELLAAADAAMYEVKKARQASMRGVQHPGPAGPGEAGHVETAP